jgi:hypothetical protein
MHKIAALAAGLICLFSPVAEAVPITGGFAEITVTDPEIRSGSVQFSFDGPGFSFTGSGGVSHLVPCLVFGPCVPGTTRGESATISGADRGLVGTVTIGGKSFGYMALQGIGPAADMDFMHTFAIPNVGLNPPDTLTLTAPFKAFGVFSAAEGETGWEGPSVFLLMTGQGIVTVNLQLLTGQSETLYQLQSSRYELSAIPEPGTAALILPVLAGLCAFSLRRRAL